MNNGIIKIYALAVCFSSILCGAITTGFFLYNVVKIITPEATINPDTVRYYSSNDTFRNSPYYPNVAGPMPFAAGPTGEFVPFAPTTKGAGDTPKLSDKEIERLRSQFFEAEISNHQVRAKQGIIQQTIIMLISAILFAVHWKLAKNTSYKPPT